MLKGIGFLILFSWKHERRYLIYRILNQFVSSMIPIAAIMIPRYIINELMGKMNTEYLLLYTGLLLGYTFVAGALSNWFTWAGFGHRIKLAQDFTLHLHEKTIKADYKDIESSDYLEMKEKAEKFLFGNFKGFSYVLDMAIDIVGKLFTLIAVISIIASLNILLVLLFVMLVLVSSYVEARTQRTQADMRLKLTAIERKSMYYSQVIEGFAYGKENRVNNLGNWLIRREQEHWSYGYELYKKHNALGMKSGVFGEFTSFIQQAVSYIYLIRAALSNAITIGDFSMYVGGVAAFSGAMRSLMQNFIEVSEYRKYYDAIEEYLSVPAHMRDNKGLPLPKGEFTIEFHNVSFVYPGQEGYALHNVNCIITPRQKISIVGENGAGKTTFIKLLCRIYDPTDGKILLNGVDIRDIEYDEYMTVFSAVFQDYNLYALSLKDNVALADSDNVPDKAVENVLREAGFSEKLDKLPKGVQTLVYRNYDGEGFEPSGGEGQKIALARALYKNAPIVILDEPAAALDPRAEYEMYQNFDRLVKGKTAVYISHRLSSTQFCDHIFVFYNGEIVEQGTHNDLLRVEGIYAELWQMQTKYYAH